MTRLNDLLPASFKGIPFFVRSEVLTEGGRRIVLHDYPNSNERYVEDLGQLPAKFSVTAFVTGPDYLNRADQLEKALQEKGRGRLQMPNFGARNVFALPYRKDASQIAVGEIRFELSFAAGKAISGPVRAAATTETVFSRGDSARAALNKAFQDKWREPNQSDNVVAAQYDLQQMTESINMLTTQVNNVADIQSQQNYITLNSPTIVRDSVTLATAVGNLWQAVSEGLVGGAGLSEVIGLTEFGGALSLSLADIRSASTVSTPSAESTGIPLWSETTGGRVLRNNNRLALVNTARVSALTIAYEQAAAADYDNDQQLDDTRRAIEDEHQRLMYEDTADVSFVQSQPEVRFAIEALRLAALEVLDDKEQTTFTLAEIRQQAPVTAFVLSYQLYAENFETSDQVTERATSLRNLNPTQPADKLNANITVLQT